jgi:hypothetical protein
MMPLPHWMRRALYTTAVMNVLASVTFMPSATALRALTGFPQTSEPLYPSTAGLFVLLFGIGYLSCAVTGRADRLFIALAAVGKLSFFALVVHLWLAGALPLRVPVLGSADLVFSILFFIWLSSTRTSVAAAPRWQAQR